MALKYFNVINGITVGNITLDATTGNATVTNLAVTGNANLTAASNVALGSNSNVKLTGGSAGQYLQTDGSGNLSWQSISSATAIANGTSNVNIPAANGNVVVSVNGVANIATFTSNAVFRGSYGLTGIISQSNTAPSSPQNGDQWYNTFNGILFEYLDDGTSSQWVDISSLPLPNLSTSNASAVLNNVQSTGTYFPAFISSTANGNYALSSNTAFSANLSNGALIATTFVGALSGAATSATTAGTVTTAAQPNITSVGTLSTLGVSGTVTASTFISNVANGIAPLVVTSTTQVANLSVATAGSATTAGTVTTAAQPNITSTGTLTSLAVTGNTTSANFIGSLANGASNVNITTAGGNVNISAGGVANVIIATTNGANVTGTLGVSGNITGGNLSTAGRLDVTGNLNVTANATVGNLGTAGTINAFQTITGSQFIATATVSAPIVTSSTTKVANLNADLLDGFDTSSVNIANTVVVRNSDGSFSANIITATLTGSATTAGTVTTAAQPNITSVGTLTSLGITGNISSGNANLGNAATANFFIGSGNNLSNIQGANVTGTVSAATTAGTVTTAAQPNITSVGTLTALTVTGNVSAGNVSATTFTGALTGNATGSAATVTTAAQPNITSVGTLTSLAVTGNTTVGNLIGPHANGNSNVNIATANGNVTIAAVGNTVVTVTGTGVNVNGTLNATGAGQIGGDLLVSGNAVVTGNLAINGNLTYLNVETIAVEDPIIQLQTGANGAAPTANSGKDVGSALNYYDTQARIAFMGWDVSNAEFGMASVATIASEVVTFTTYGNLRVGNIIGNGQALTAIAGANVTGAVAFATTANAVAGANVSGTVANATFATSAGSATTATSATTAGTVTTAAQPNITSVSTSFTGLTFVANAQITMSGAGSQISGVNLVSANSFSGNGSSITGINASSIASGTLAQARLANSTITFGNTTLTLGGTTTTVAGLTSVTSTTFVGALTGAATTAGTVTTAAQPNITSVGTLTGLTSGPATFTPSAAPAVDALTPNNGTTGGLRVRGNATSNVAYIQFTDAAASAQWSFLSVANTGVAAYNATFNPTTLQTTALTAGSNVTAGTITGNWSLSAGSRLTATYADIAEKYVADATYEPGTVLSFGGEQEVTLATTFDSTKVAGVVTTDPAYSMNSALEAEHVAEIALQGRVPCKVIGPIEKGDLMVSASNGHATANNDARAGTIIGKALENFNGDFGVIEVAVGRF